MIWFFVEGLPLPQGSKVPGVTKEGRPYLRDVQSANLKAWRRQIATTAQLQASGYGAAAIGSLLYPKETPVSVDLQFQMERGKTVTREYPTTKPDLDKLVRAAFDGITDARNVWQDDCQVVTLRTDKVYSERVGLLVRLVEVRV